MRRASAFALLPVNSSGIPVGLPLVAYAGDDSNRTTADDGFVRRFVARQIANPCPAIGNCAGATFTAQGLAQWRIPLRPRLVNALERFPPPLPAFAYFGVNNPWQIVLPKWKRKARLTLLTAIVSNPDLKCRTRQLTVNITCVEKTSMCNCPSKTVPAASSRRFIANLRPVLTR